MRILLYCFFGLAFFMGLLAVFLGGDSGRHVSSGFSTLLHGSRVEAQKEKNIEDAQRAHTRIKDQQDYTDDQRQRMLDRSRDQQEVMRDRMQRMRDRMSR